MIMTYLHPYLVAVGLKGFLGLKFLVRGQDFLDTEISNITVVIIEDCFCTTSLIGRSYLQLGKLK